MTNGTARKNKRKERKKQDGRLITWLTVSPLILQQNGDRHLFQTKLTFLSSPILSLKETWAQNMTISFAIG